MKTNTPLTRNLISSLLLAGGLLSCQKEDLGVQPANSNGPVTDTSVQEATVAKNLKGLMVLIDFSDAPANMTLSRTSDVMNGIGYKEANVKSSVRDY